MEATDFVNNEAFQRYLLERQIPRKPSSEPFFIEVDDNGCKHCGRGRTYTIIGPNDVGLGTSYEDEEQASELCEMLNGAYYIGASNSPEPTERGGA